MKQFIRKSPLLLIWGAILFHSCTGNRVLDENHIIPQGIWQQENRLVFTAGINDTVQPCNIYLHIRNDLSYPFSNLFLFLRTRFPDGSVSRDTIECQLAGPDGRWLGSGVGNIRSNRFLFQQNFRFPRRGNYVFELEQAMRMKELKGIRNAGIMIEKVNP